MINCRNCLSFGKTSAVCKFTLVAAQGIVGRGSSLVPSLDRTETNMAALFMRTVFQRQVGFVRRGIFGEYQNLSPVNLTPFLPKQIGKPLLKCYRYWIWEIPAYKTTISSFATSRSCRMILDGRVIRKRDETGQDVFQS